MHFSYRVGFELTVKDAVFDFLRIRRARATREIHALRGITLEVEPGTRLGLIGRNGAGKSTLLRVIAGIYPPQAGEVHVSGHPACLFSTGGGFDNDSTGWENIVTRSLLLGASPAQIEARTPWIAEFSELGEFLDLPVRTYSSGMRTRLAFAISTAYETDLLLIDEVMGAGDEGFRAKAKRRFLELTEQASTLVFCSHGLNVVADVCERTVWVKDGKVRLDGPSEQVIRAYRAWCKGEAPVAPAEEDESWGESAVE